MRKLKHGNWLGMLLSVAMLVGGIGFFPVQVAEAATQQVVLGENIIENPNFADADISMWSGSGAELTAQTSEEEILPGVTTYATVSGRTQTFQGFLQDVTGKVKAGETYQIDYYMKLSDDYAKEAADGRKAFFGPYLKLTAGGEDYLNQEYSSCIKGDLSKTVALDQWVHFSGTFTLPEDVAFNGVVVRFQEESSSFKGSYSITGVSMRRMETQEVFIETDVTPWKDAITEAFGEDAIAGLAMTAGEMADKGVFQLVTKHANAFTFGNELKPDYLFNYSNGSCPGKETITFNGITMEVPKINFEKIDKLVDRIVKWNSENPDNKLKVRGHTLLWHAQTPEWFFHEGYDPSKEYVSKEVLRLRMEWYIKTVLEHFTSEKSPYKDLFYGWDVLNEAANDGSSMAFRDDTGGNDKLTDSTHNSKSSWWHVYKSSDYIVDAFTFANKYAPASLELYYNDYGDSSPNKCKNICEILKLIKEHEGPAGEGTRISAMGMQAHYSLNDFNLANFEQCARNYLDIVGAIQLTELDMAASSSYNGTRYTRDLEYMKQALCFQSIFDTLKKLNSEEGYRVTGITFWGVIDTTSWLQKKSDLGGGSDGLRSQCPLLFDGEYKVKPAYWAFVDPTKILPVRQTYQAVKTQDRAFKDCVEGSFGNSNNSATFKIVWDDSGLKVRVTVKDTTNNEDDIVTLYVDTANSQKKGVTPLKLEKGRKDGKHMSGGGYEVEFDIPIENISVGQVIGVDFAINDQGEKLYYSDINGNQETSSEFYAEVTLFPGLMLTHKGTVVVDGEKDEVWDTAEKISPEIGDAASAGAEIRTLWDQTHLYVYAEITDDELNAAAKDAAKQDSLEIYINEDGIRTMELAKDDRMYRISCENQVTMLGEKAKDGTVQSQVIKTDKGYVIEAAIQWKSVNMTVHNAYGLEFRLNDASADGTLRGTLNWADNSGDEVIIPARYGRVKLAAEGKVPEEPEESPEGEITDGSDGASDEASGEAQIERKRNRIPVYVVGAVCLAVILLVLVLAVRRKKSKGDSDNK